jgi:2-amino-4-hydroxy-6-hydroxymethyldihydropteridine diphosphokinase
LTLVPAFIALGSNLDDPAAQVRAGFEELAMLRDTRLARVSSLYRSAAVGYTGQPDFINAVAFIETALEPRELLSELLLIETRRGRKRNFPNAPRTLDLDIVVYADRVIDEPGLTIPHPRMYDRPFVLVPLAEIDPDALVPGYGSAGELAARTNHASLVKLDA